jgi:hypothetical protein
MGVGDRFSSGSGILELKRVPLAHRRWFCESPRGEWIFIGLFDTALLNGYTHPTNPMTNLTFAGGDARPKAQKPTWKRSLAGDGLEGRNKCIRMIAVCSL